MLKKKTDNFATILAKKQSLIELGHHHVQVLREELDALKTELDSVRKAAKLNLETTHNAARFELEAVQNAARAELQQHQEAARVKLENVRNSANTILEMVWTVRSIHFEWYLPLL